MERNKILTILKLYNINFSSVEIVRQIQDTFGLNLDHQDLEDLDFLNREEFSGLLQLSCSYNNLDSLDYYLPELEFLTCRDIGLRELDLSNFPNLRSLDCSVNKIPRLDLSEVPELEYLICSFNKIDELSFETDNKIRWLDIEGNNISRLAVTELPDLEFLDFRGNPVQNLGRTFRQLHDIIVPKQLYRFLDEEYMHTMAYFLMKAGYKLPDKFYDILDR